MAVDTLAAAFVAVEENADLLRGPQGSEGKAGLDGHDGSDGKAGLDGRDGLDGKAGTDGQQGPPGEDGPDGEDGLGISWRGPWKAGWYDEQDAVEFEGSSYIARTRTRAKPPKGAWDLMAKRGADGQGGVIYRSSGPGGGSSSGTGSGLPAGGVQGQALVKASSTDGDAVWGPFGLLPDPGATWPTATVVTLGQRISVPGTNLSSLVWEVTTAGTTGGTIPDFEGVPLGSGTIADNTVTWTFRGYVNKVIGGQSLEAPADLDGSTGSSIITEAGLPGVAGDLYIRGGHGAAGNDGGKVAIQGGFSDAGAIERAYLEVTGAEVGNERGGHVYALAGPSANGNVGASFRIYGGDDDTGRGGPVQFNGGDGSAGQTGGFAELAAGSGSGAVAGGQLRALGGNADGVTPGRVTIRTDDLTGDLGDVLTAQGDGTAIWAPGGGLSGSAQTYTESNVTTDRTYNANATSIDELADALGTLIGDLRSRGIVA